MTPEQDLIIAAARVARAAPDSWLEFLKAFNVYSLDMSQKLVGTPIDMVLVAQGRAQNAAAVSRLLEKCTTTVVVDPRANDYSKMEGQSWSR